MLKTFIPTAKLLQQYIELIYVFKNNIPERFSYIAFPHVNTAVSFFRGVHITRKNHEVIIKEDAKNLHNCHIEILGKYTKPVFVHYHGAFEEIAVVFKPFGINQFVRAALIDIAPEYSQALTIDNWNKFAPILFNEKTEKKRLEMVEAFLISNFYNIINDPVSKALNYLSDVSMDYSIKKIADIIGMTVKSFQRLFVKNITCTPIEYKRIARFRHSLNSRLLSKEIRLLTNVAYDNNYYDQSYFIREYKKLTNLNPKQFFNTITLMDEKKIIWEIK